jgi:hypothetical protein
MLDETFVSSDSVRVFELLLFLRFLFIDLSHLYYCWSERVALFAVILNDILIIEYSVEAAPGISFRVGWAHPTPILTPILKNFLHALENFQGGLNILSGGLSPPQPTPGAATSIVVP